MFALEFLLLPVPKDIHRAMAGKIFKRKVIMNDYKIYNENCFKIFPKIKDSSVDCVIVDLPYGQTNCKWDIPIDLEKMWVELLRVGTDETAYVFFTTTKFGYELIKSNEKLFRYDLVWEKPNAVGFLMSQKRPLRAHEMIYIFSKKQTTYNPQKTIGVPYRANRKANSTNIYGAPRTPCTVNTGDRFPRSVQQFSSPSRYSVHPTQKPIELCEWLVKTYSNEGQTVLDFTMGSGSTGVAALKTKRKFIGIEMNSEIYQTAKDRLNALLEGFAQEEKSDS